MTGRLPRWISTAQGWIGYNECSTARGVGHGGRRVHAAAAENLDLLADELSLVLTAVATEVSVGSFYLDIQAETEDGRTVVLENQRPAPTTATLGSCRSTPRASRRPS